MNDGRPVSYRRPLTDRSMVYCLETYKHPMIVHWQFGWQFRYLYSVTVSRNKRQQYRIKGFGNRRTKRVTWTILYRKFWLVSWVQLPEYTHELYRNKTSRVLRQDSNGIDKNHRSRWLEYNFKIRCFGYQEKM